MNIAFITQEVSPYNGWGRISTEIIKRAPAFEIKPICLTGLQSVRETRRKLFHIVLDSFSAWEKVKNCDAIHVLIEPLFPVGLILSMLTRKPLFLSIHGTYTVTTLRTFLSPLYRLAYYRAAIIFSPSKFTANRLFSLVKGLEEKTTIVPWGVTITKLSHYIDIRENSFVTIGEIKKRKGIHVLIEALAIVKKKVPNIKLYICGDTQDKVYLKRLEGLISSHNLERNISWRGKVSEEERIKLLSKTKSLVMPSISTNNSFEGFGLVHLEAHSMGTPSIGTWGSGNEEIIEDFVNGYLVEQENVEILANRMLLMLDNEIWFDLSRKAISTSKKYSWGKVLDCYRFAYDSFVTSSSAKSSLESSSSFVSSS